MALTVSYPIKLLGAAISFNSSLANINKACRSSPAPHQEHVMAFRLVSFDPIPKEW
jgi:hypothetical protein